MCRKIFEIQACWKLVREPGTPTQKESSQPMNAPRVLVDLILQGWTEKKIGEKYGWCINVSSVPWFCLRGHCTKRYTFVFQYLWSMQCAKALFLCSRFFFIAQSVHCFSKAVKQKRGFNKLHRLKSWMQQFPPLQHSNLFKPSVLMQAHQAIRSKHKA